MNEGMRLALAIGAAVVLATAVAGTRAAAAGADLKVDPPSVAVAKGQVFALQVVQDSPVATSGAQASVDFDPSLLQVVSVERGAGYSLAPVFVPHDLQADIKLANATGHLAQIAAAFTPPDAVPAGTASFLIVHFRAVGCGQTAISLPTSGPFNAQMISGQSSVYGADIPVTTSSGRVTTCVGPDVVSEGDVASGQAAAPDPSAPVAIAGVAVGVAIAAAVGAFVFRSRRRVQPDEELVD